MGLRKGTYYSTAREIEKLLALCSVKGANLKEDLRHIRFSDLSFANNLNIK